jgi:hypothetical protein
MNTIKELLQQLSTLTAAQNAPQSFVGLCRTVYAIKQHFSRENTYLNPDNEIRYRFDDLMAEYGLEKTQTSRLLCSHDKYFDNNEIKPLFAEFSKWKLFYLLSVPTSKLEPDIKAGRISAFSSVKEIRKYVNHNKDKNEPVGISADTDEPDDDDIPPVYDPTKYYDFEYVQTRTKNQLINMFWELQKRYVKRQ